ncbi:hypothetical protein [Olleya sp. Bg11-27]|uniref:hypothetical protein n=1 Tax=Olleya sp. Bg11-27 TaxID=2058135 RepID=UPI000C310CE3|nr:hypothetical protein [Olleya sp. Bg11-27]AUC77628.1 hypothetical protein CW732_18865 [Olleya sp. Bg11-27]
MSAIFKEKIVPKLKLASLVPSEVKAILHILELMDATDTDAYKKAKKNSDSENTIVSFTENVAQNIYFHPKVYGDKKEGLELIASWLPLLKKGFFPDEKSANKLVEFLTFSLSYLQTDAVSEDLKTQLFQVLKMLVQSESEASLPIASFLIDRIFDIRDVLSADFLIQFCIRYQILNETYSVVHSDKTITKFPFKIDNAFIQHFFDNDWRKFITKFHHILPVGRIYVTSAYDLMLPWFTTDLAAYYYNNLEVIFEAHKAIKERLIFGDAKSLELLNLKTSEGFYPLIAALGPRLLWDAGDTLLFNNRDKDIPQEQLDVCYLRFIDWLIADGGSNFYSEAFKDYGKLIFTENTAEALPLKCIPFWFDKCHPQSGIKNQTETYNTIFSDLLIEERQGKLPIMRFDHKDFQMTGEFLIKNVFQTKDNLKGFLHGFIKQSIKNPLNQFLVRTFFDAREQLFNLYNAEQQEILQLYLLEMAYSTRDVRDDIRKQNLPLITKTLITLCVEPGNYSRVNEIGALKSIDACVAKICNTFAGGHYINEARPLELNIIQAWFNYLGDFYYSSRQEAVWVSDLLTTQGARTATYFNDREDDTSYFLDKAINRIITFHRKCKIKTSENVTFAKISKEIEVYLTDFLSELKKDKLILNTTKFLSDYSQSTIADFSNQTELVTAIEAFYNIHFKGETITETPTAVDNSQTITFKMEVTEINQKYVDAVLHNLEHYSENGSYDTELLQPLDEKIEEYKVWLLDDETGMQVRMGQALYMTLLDTNLAPGTAQETYGNLCRSLFVHLVKDTQMAPSYGMGLQAMAKSGAYSDHLTTALLQVVDDLNA